MSFNDINNKAISIPAFKFAIPYSDSYGNTNISGCLGIAREFSSEDPENFMFIQDLQVSSIID